jgi:hypothetical protein
MIEVTENDAREYLENLHKIGAADSSELQAAKKNPKSRATWQWLERITL